MWILNGVHSEKQAVPGTLRHGSRALLVVLLVSAALSGPTAHAQQTSSQQTSSQQARPTIPNAEVVTTERDTVSIQSLTGESVTVLMFWSNQCPWVDRYESRVRDLTEQFAGDGVRFILVNSNDASMYPEESVEKNAERVAFASRSVPYVSDPSGEVAAAVNASRAPHAFVFDHSEDGRLVYNGAIDDSPAAADNVEEAYLKAVLVAVLAGNDIPFDETKAFGCTIKSGT
jgi:peroxiredoxin